MKLWKAAAPRGVRLTDGVSCPTRRASRATRSGGSEISQVPRQRGLGRVGCPDSRPMSGTGHDPGARNRSSSRRTFGRDGASAVKPPRSRPATQRPMRRSRRRRRRCKKPRCTRCMSRAAPAWCRSPATTCRCSMPTASSPSTITCAPRPACSTSRTWARRSSSAPTTRRSRARSRRWCPGDIVGPRARPPALHPVARREWRHPRRPDGDALGRSGRGRRAVSGRQRRHQGGGLRASRRRACPPACGCCAPTIAR